MAFYNIKQITTVYVRAVYFFGRLQSFEEGQFPQEKPPGKYA